MYVYMYVWDNIKNNILKNKSLIKQEVILSIVCAKSIRTNV